MFCGTAAAALPLYVLPTLGPRAMIWNLPNITCIRPFKGLIGPFKGLIKLFEGLIRPFKGLIRPFKGVIRLFKGLIRPLWAL